VKVTECKITHLPAVKQTHSDVTAENLHICNMTHSWTCKLYTAYKPQIMLAANVCEFKFQKTT